MVICYALLSSSTVCIEPPLWAFHSPVDYLSSGRKCKNLPAITDFTAAKLAEKGVAFVFANPLFHALRKLSNKPLYSCFLSFIPL